MPAYRYTGELDPAVYPSLVDTDGRTVTVRPGDLVTLPEAVDVYGLTPADPAPRENTAAAKVAADQAALAADEAALASTAAPADPPATQEA